MELTNIDLKLTKEEIFDIIKEPKEFLRLLMDMERHFIEVSKEMDRYEDRERWKGVQDEEK